MVPCSCCAFYMTPNTTSSGGLRVNCWSIKNGSFTVILAIGSGRWAWSTVFGEYAVALL